MSETAQDCVLEKETYRFNYVQHGDVKRVGVASDSLAWRDWKRRERRGILIWIHFLVIAAILPSSRTSNLSIPAHPQRRTREKSPEAVQRTRAGLESTRETRAHRIKACLTFYEQQSTEAIGP